jgi:hypothetical protein
MRETIYTFKKDDEVKSRTTGKTGTITEVSEDARYPYRVVFADGSQGVYAASELVKASIEVKFGTHWPLEHQLREWIDIGVITGALLDIMAEVAKPEEMTFENAKHIYYDFLEKELKDALERSVRHIFRG